MAPGGRHVRRAAGALAPAAAVLLFAAACGGGIDDGEAKAVALRALAAYADGDVMTLCELTPAAKKAQFVAGTTCTTFYARLFVQQSGQDAIDQAMRPPYRPGTVAGVRHDADRRIVTIRPTPVRLTGLQRRELVLRYGRDATALRSPPPIQVTVSREDGRLVAGF